MMVEVDADYQPDAVVNSGPPTPDDAIAAPNPVIVVEVLFPRDRGVDTGAKLMVTSASPVSSTTSSC